MNEKLFSYCERGLDPGFWAEPLNAISNAGFLLAGLVHLWLWRRQSRAERQTMVALFSAILIGIGIGSFLFHTLATRWAAIADVAPIGIFMLSYWAYAVRRYLGANWAIVVLATVGFAASLWLAGEVRCPPAGGLALGGSGTCLNGSLGYAPALLAMPLIGTVAASRRHPAAPLLFAAGAVFAVSLTLRSLDFALCEALALGDYRIGTHLFWHLLNATTLYLLVLAARRHGSATFAFR